MRFSLGAFSGFLLLAILATTPAASAQVHIFLTPVPNSPFTAIAEVQRTGILHDGSAFSHKTFRMMARDSIGRIHNESRAFIQANSIDTPPIVAIHLYDPRTRISTELDGHSHTFRTFTVNHPPSTVPPTVRFGSPSGVGLPQSDFSREEDLGTQQIEGLSARGVRETQIIPAESSETGKEITVTDEYWYSDELRINVMMKHNDPRKGITTLTVTHIARGEPDPALLEIPEGYTRAGAPQPEPQAH
jgi:hypothetical protein